MGVQVIPLFPLATMAVPGLRLPLRIFEPRYRELIDDLQELPEEERNLGVVALKLGNEAGLGPIQMYDVGTIVRVQRVARRSDGTLSVVAVGLQRFRLLSTVADSGTPYLTGRVEVLSDDDATDDSARAAAADVRDALRRLNSQFGTPNEDLPEIPRVLSYMVLASAPLNYADRQRLLEIPDVLGRLRREAHLLRLEQALFRELGAISVSQPWESGSLN